MITPTDTYRFTTTANDKFLARVAKEASREQNILFLVSNKGSKSDLAQVLVRTSFLNKNKKFLQDSIFINISKVYSDFTLTYEGTISNFSKNELVDIIHATVSESLTKIMKANENKVQVKVEAF